MMKFAWKIIIILRTLIASVYSKPDFYIRLSGGDTIYKGRLEVYYGREWGTVCDNGWGERDARVVCHERGFGAPIRYLIRNIYEGHSSQPIWLDEVGCKGWESRLAICPSKLGSKNNCSHSEDVALECSSTEGGIYVNVGRLELFYNREWNELCFKQWSETNSEVACKQLGFLRSDTTGTDPYHLPSNYGPHRFKFSCTGVESTLEECSSDPFEEYGCLPVLIYCTNELDKKYSQGDVRLVGGEDDLQGIVEVYLYGIWGTMCTRNWNDVESRVVCRQLGFEYTEEDHDLFEYDTSVVSSRPVHDIKIDCSGTSIFGPKYTLSSCRMDHDTKSMCNHTEDVAFACRNRKRENLEEDTLSSSSIIVLVGLVAVCVLLLVFACSCRRKTRNQLSTNNGFTASASATSIPLEPQSDGRQDYSPSGPSSFDSQPLEYDSIMHEPERYKSSIEIEEMPPPAYVRYETTL